LSLARYFRSAVIAVGLASLAVVLTPQYTEPLWAWTQSVAGVVAHDPLPTFDVTQHWSGLALAAFVLGGIAYNQWRDRRHRVLQAEYHYRTGASHLKAKVAELQAQLNRVTADRDKWEGAHATLSKKHTDALVASKEHEVRSEFGRDDRQALAELRKELDALVHAKGHIEGFREAMHFFLASMPDAAQPPKVTVEATTKGSGRERPTKGNCPALPYALPSNA
jgi:hypothetical protein